MTIPDPLPNSDLPAETETIWQFMPLPALLSLLQKKQLFFRRLTELDDPLEGKFFTPIFDSLNRSFQESGLNRGADPWTAERFEASGREHWYVNCWHLNPVPSARMWKQYASDNGVAIRSTVGSLLHAFRVKHRITMNRVHYQSEATSLNAVFPPFHKQPDFDHEKEYRALVMLTNSDASAVKHDGFYVAVDLDALVEGVHLSPDMQPWVAEVISFEVRERLGKVCVPSRHSQEC
jgi:hypothetical protein